MNPNTPMLPCRSGSGVLAALALGLISLVGCVQTGSVSAEVLPPMEELPPGYPPKMGTATVSGAQGGKVYTTYDFSVGAFDASAWFDVEDGKQRFALIGYPDQNHEAEVGRLHLVTHFAAPPKAGSKGTDAMIEVYLDGKHDGKRMSTAHTKARIVIDSFTKNDPTNTSGYGHVTGHFAGRMCPTDGEPDKAVVQATGCEDVAGSFDTDVQYEP